MRAQVERFGVEILPAQAVTAITTQGDYKTVRTETGDEYSARALLLATGSRYRRLGVPGEEDFIGAGIHFCATCDGPFYKGQEMVVVGGGNSGVEEGLFLTKFASKVTVLEVQDRLGASQVLQEKLANHPKMEARLQATVQEFKGNGHLDSVVVKDLRSGAVEELRPGAVFVFIGLDPNTLFLEGVVELDRWKFIVTSETLETSVEGVFTAGDARAGSIKQITSTAGEGTTADPISIHFDPRPRAQSAAECRAKLRRYTRGSGALEGRSKNAHGTLLHPSSIYAKDDRRPSRSDVHRIRAKETGDWKCRSDRAGKRGDRNGPHGCRH